jgi:hypothetical protein
MLPCEQFDVSVRRQTALAGIHASIVCQSNYALLCWVSGGECGVSRRVNLIECVAKILGNGKRLGC